MKIVIVGMGYVGSALCEGLKNKHSVFGYDIVQKPNATTDPSIMDDADAVLICVPTGVDEDNNPDLTPLISAFKTVAKHSPEVCLVVNESTVFPGCTRNLAYRYLETREFGYSPERVDPGNKENNIHNTVKLIGADNNRTLNRMTEVYLALGCPLFTCSIEEAEAAKLLENTQRDVNIAFMNEAALYLHDKGIDAHQVFSAMKTKWNALNFRPGLVGGHCIAVDPYYLLSDAVRPMKTIEEARETNLSLPFFVVSKVLQHSTGDVLILGESYKANVDDVRTSQSRVIERELKRWKRNVYVYDPVTGRNDFAGGTVYAGRWGAQILAVGHDCFINTYLDAPLSINLTNIDATHDAKEYWRLG